MSMVYKPFSKKRILFFGIILIGVMALSGCVATKQKKEENSVFSIVTTVFPAYDFAKQIGGDKVDVTLLLPPGVESHSYEPTPRDMVAISECDLLITVGGESEAWLERLLSGIQDEGFEVLSMMSLVELYRETDPLKRDVAGEEEYDEHVWTSPKNAIGIVKGITKQLSGMDVQNKSSYEYNEAIYVKQLEELHESYQTTTDKAEHKVLVFGDRFPFLYMEKEYNLECFAAFPGCSGESEPSAATMASLSRIIKEKNISYVCYLELSNPRVAEALGEVTGAKTIRLHSCHNVSKEELEQGVSYLSLMQDNLLVLKEVLK